MLKSERLSKALAGLGKAICETVSALGELLSLFDTEMLAAYAAASKQHPDWVRRANHSKKRRVQKKYHDKIMREYRRVNNG